MHRWRIVIHGGIDGYSRLVVYLQASANNRADTVLTHFRQAVETHGVPSRVRSDKGGENRGVAAFMVSVRGMDRNSHIAGKSVHNQRYRVTCQTWCIYHDNCHYNPCQHYPSLKEMSFIRIIERLWRDVYMCVTDLFHSIFSSLEDEGLLSPDNDVHIFALHWVFLRRLQHHLDCFVDGWNSHPLRTERNRSPLQLWHTNIGSEASPDPPEVQ